MPTKNTKVGGYVIPRGSVIFLNICERIWFPRVSSRMHEVENRLDGLYRDEAAYADPNVFNPDRYIKSELGTIPGADNIDRRGDLHFGAGRVRLACTYRYRRIFMILIAALLPGYGPGDKLGGACRYIASCVTAIYISPVANKTLATVHLLWGFNIKAAEDTGSGQKLPIDPNTFTEVCCWEGTLIY